MSIRRCPALLPVLIVALLIVVADQLSKWWIIEHMLRDTPLKSFGTWMVTRGAQESLAPIPVMPSFNLVMVWNKGISFGLLQHHDALMPYILSASGLLIVAGFLWWARHTTSRLMMAATGLIVGGALGNIWDRWRFGAVADFFDVYVGSYHWPAFNVADSAITIGVVIFLIHMLLEKPAAPVHTV